VAEFDDDLITVDTEEAAITLGLLDGRGRPNRRAVQRYIRMGLLEALHYGRGYRIPLRALQRFQQQSRIQPFDPRNAVDHQAG